MWKNSLLLILFVSLLVNAVFLALFLSAQIIKFRSAKSSAAAVTATAAEKDNLFDEINPTAGYEIDVKYGDLGPRMVSAGIIDPKKFTEIYEKSNQPLTPEQKEILLSGSDQKIKITRDNAYFLLNFFWAAGLANKSKILDEGEMTKYGGKQGVGNFASTGGWILAKGKTLDYYSKSPLIPLTNDQALLVESVASNIFRPCCNNSTAFPDCNHGMALLGVLQIMAGSGATEAQMYQAGKYFNAFWFPGNYYDLALYFKNKEGKSFWEVDPKTILAKDYSSASGWQAAKQWLADKGLIQPPPKQGGSCGV